MTDRDGDERANDGLLDRDYSQEFAVTLSWRDWNKVWSLVSQGIYEKDEDECPDEEIERNRELQSTLATEIGAASPGNGIEDWPGAMKKAYDETVMEMMRDD